MGSERYYLKRDWSFIEEGGYVVLLRADYTCFRVSNKATQLLRSLMKQPQTEEHLLAEMSGKLSLTEFFYLLEQFKQRGVVGCVASKRSFRLAHTSGVATEEMERLAVVLGEDDKVESVGIWKELQQVSSDSLVVLLVPNYHHVDIIDFNRLAYKQGWRWMPVAIGDDTIWVGPHFGDAGSGCFECLSFRYYHQSPILHRIYQHHNLCHSAHPASWQKISMAAKAIRNEADAKEMQLTLVRRIGEETKFEHHNLEPWPHCPTCSGEGEVSEDIPVRLQSRPKIGYTDGGERAEDAAKTVRRLIDYVDPFTSEVGKLTTLVSPGDGYGYSMVMSQWATLEEKDVQRDGIIDWKKGRISSIGVSAGKGQTLEQAQASAIGESIERYSTQYFGYEPLRKAYWREIADTAVSPHVLACFSENQFTHREEWGKKSLFSQVPEPWNEEIPLHWGKGWSLTHRAVRWLPAAYLFYSFKEDGVAYMYGDSNGVSAGNCIEEAILQGLFELVERDAVGAWWYNRVCRPQLDLDAWPATSVQTFRSRMQQRGYDVWALDLTTEFRIPVVMAIAFSKDPKKALLMGIGAHYQVEIALQRAMAEITQSLGDEVSAATWWNELRCTDHSFLFPDSSKPMRKPADFIDLSTNDLLTDIERAVALMQEHGLEVIVYNLSRKETKLNVIRVVVPGLSHFWPRFADPRIYLHPVTLGWSERELTENELNPIPFPI